MASQVGHPHVRPVHAHDEPPRRDREDKQPGRAAVGGILVTLPGSSTGATAVTFGGKSATFTVASDTEITATSPAHAAASVSVVVHSPGGVSAKNHKFTYV
jgi:hypothetical protein